MTIEPCEGVRFEFLLALLEGSCLHAARALTHHRWEDYNYEPLDDAPKNRFHWLGNGHTVADQVVGSDSKSSFDMGRTY